MFFSHRHRSSMTVWIVPAALCLLLLSGCGAGVDPSLATLSVSIPALPTEDLIGPCQYDLLVANPELSLAAQPPIKGLFVLFQRGDTDVLYQSESLRKAIFAQQFAIIWAHQCNARSTGDLQADASQGPGRILRVAIQELAEKSGHHEIASSSLILYGFSAAGVLTATMENEYPDRIIGAITYAAGSAYVNLDKLEVTATAARIPTLILANAADTASGTQRSLSYFNRGRSEGAPWEYAVQGTDGHCCNISTLPIIVPWIQSEAKAATQAVAAGSSGSAVAPNSTFVCTPNGIVDAQGLVNCSFTSAALGRPQSSTADAGWLPDQASGDAWVAWVTNKGTN